MTNKKPYTFKYHIPVPAHCALMEDTLDQFAINGFLGYTSSVDDKGTWFEITVSKDFTNWENIALRIGISLGRKIDSDTYSDLYKFL